jgi:rubrerythrin
MTNDPGSPVKPPPELLHSQTHDHLRAAFAVEAQVQQMLAYFAQVAEIEGQAGEAELLRALAEAHSLHAHGHLDLLRRAADPLTGLPMGLTARNLACAAALTRLAGAETYARMVKTAEAEGFLDVADWLKTVARANETAAARLTRRGDA